MIDWDRIAELRNDVLGEDFPEVFAMFLEEVEEVLDRMQNAPDLLTLEADCHFLKGGAINLGFTDFGETCCLAEKAAANGNGPSVDIQAIRNVYQASLSKFMQRAAEFGLAA